MNLPDALSVADQCASRRFTEADEPISFIGFCRHLGVHLDEEHGTLGQRVVALVSFDGMQPRDLRGREREIAREIFGDLETISEAQRQVLVAICGARAGKSYVIVALRLLHLGLTVDISPLAPGEVGSVPIIAPDKELAEQVLNYIRGAIKSDPALTAMVVGDPDAGESVTILRDGHEIEFVIRAASGRGRTGRGRSLLAAALDEICFFLDRNYKVNDEDMYKAVAPRIMPGGQLLLDSTPWVQSGLAFDLFVANHPNPKQAGIDAKPRNAGTALALHAPTLTLRDTTYTREMVAKERARDSDNAEREYGALFVSASSVSFFDAAAIAQMIDDALPLEPIKPMPGDIVTAGGDIGLRRNMSAFAAAYRRGDTVTLAELRLLKPERGKPLKPSETCAIFRDRIQWHGGTRFMGDQHYLDTAVEVLEPVGIEVIAAPATPAVAWVRVRTLMNEGRIRVPNHPRLIKQLRETLKRELAGGAIQIVKPTWPDGSHGDEADAFVRAVYQAWGEEVPAPAPERGTQGWEDEIKEERRQRALQKQEAPWWRRKKR